MVYWGYEADRRTHKFRCPAVVNGFPCKGREACCGTNKKYGRLVRVPIDLNPRIFTPLARCTDAWAKAYKRRTSVERVNSRKRQINPFFR